MIEVACDISEDECCTLLFKSRTLYLSHAFAFCCSLDPYHLGTGLERWIRDIVLEGANSRAFRVGPFMSD